MTTRLLASIAIAITATPVLLTAQTSEYFVMTGDEASFHVLQNGQIVRSWAPAAGSDTYQYPLAVAGTVRAFAKNAGDLGAEYDLDGNDLGTRYLHPGSPVGTCWDGTTDGANNYAIDTGGKVWQFDRDWGNPVTLFDAGGFGSLAYDATSQTLWIAQWSSQTVTEYDLTGSSISSFSTGHTQNMALAFDHADNTLWLHDRNAQGTFEQWTRAGTLLQRIAIPGMATENVLGGDMAIPNSASCTFRNGSGVNPTDFDCVTPPLLAGTWTTSFQHHANTLATLLAVGVSSSPGLPAFGGEVLIGIATAPITIAGTGDIPVPMPANPTTVGTALFAQGFRLDVAGPAIAIVPLNAQDVVIGY